MMMIFHIVLDLALVYFAVDNFVLGAIDTDWRADLDFRAPENLLSILS